MSEFNWNSYLKQHPLFSDLRDSEIAQLLDERVSIEKSVAQNQTIVREGDKDQSIYLIGQGSADVFLKGSDDQDVIINSLEEGDLIGELAFFEQGPRSATVIATEPCILLKFNRQEFSELLHVHPEIGFKLLVKLSERLRNLGDNVLNVKLKKVDEKIKHVNAKIDTELKIVDASLKASQTVFDQTSKRASEVIESADRARTRFTVAASTLGTIFTVLLAVLSYVGVSKVLDVTKMSSDVQSQSQLITEKGQEITQIREQLRSLVKTAEEDVKSIQSAIDDIASAKDDIASAKGDLEEFYHASLVAQFRTDLGSDIERAKKTYASILSLKDDEVSDAIYEQLVVKILSGEKKDREGYAKILEASRSNTDRQKALSSYLLLSIFILNDDDDNRQYDENLGAFKAALKDSKPIKDEETAAHFGAAIFEEVIKEGANVIDKSQEEKITKINAIWELIE